MDTVTVNTILWIGAVVLASCFGIIFGGFLSSIKCQNCKFRICRGIVDKSEDIDFNDELS